MEYTIELRDSSGNLLQVFKNASNIILEETINAPMVLSFNMPSTDPKLHYITKATEFWAREVVGDTVIAKTKILLQEDKR